jgi:hypothetical protein
MKELIEKLRLLESGDPTFASRRKTESSDVEVAEGQMSKVTYSKEGTKELIARAAATGWKLKGRLIDDYGMKACKFEKKGNKVEAVAYTDSFLPGEMMVNWIINGGMSGNDSLEDAVDSWDESYDLQYSQEDDEDDLEESAVQRGDALTEGQIEIDDGLLSKMVTDWATGKLTASEIADTTADFVNEPAPSFDDGGDEVDTDGPSSFEPLDFNDSEDDEFVMQQATEKEVDESVNDYDDFSTYSDYELQVEAEKAGLEEIVVLDGEGGLANRDEVISALEDVYAMDESVEPIQEILLQEEPSEEDISTVLQGVGLDDGYDYFFEGGLVITGKETARVAVNALRNAEMPCYISKIDEDEQYRIAFGERQAKTAPNKDDIKQLAKVDDYVTEGKVKELSQDLKSATKGGLTDGEFLKKYGKIKSAMKGEIKGATKKQVTESINLNIQAEGEDALDIIRKLSGVDKVEAVTSTALSPLSYTQECGVFESRHTPDEYQGEHDPDDGKKMGPEYWASLGDDPWSIKDEDELGEGWNDRLDDPDSYDDHAERREEQAEFDRESARDDAAERELGEGWLDDVVDTVDRGAGWAADKVSTALDPLARKFVDKFGGYGSDEEALDNELFGDDLEEDFANEPDEEYTALDAILAQGNDLNKPKQMSHRGGLTGGDNPMESVDKIKQSLQAKYKNFK